MRYLSPSQYTTNIRQIIHNPGVVPDARLALDTTDITVVFEESYKRYRTLESDLNSLSEDRSHYAFMVHSIPSKTNIQKFVDSISHHAEYMFVSTASQNYYEKFGPKWQQFTDAVPS
jgi:hypothetical protein